MTDSDRVARAEALLDEIFSPSWRDHEGGVAWPSEAGLDFARLCVEHCYADAWSRKGSLDLKTRSLITLTALASQGATEELKLHVRGALNLGHAPDDVVELFIHLIPYLGVPRVVQAMRCAGEVLREHAGD
ncbi:MAG: carboxymuconolactone decarboxylase family protein [Myxococcales bacterium]|nr:carboxymuconolactone decarboxylase family protein [Myxococcales bacterium]